MKSVKGAMLIIPVLAMAQAACVAAQDSSDIAVSSQRLIISGHAAVMPMLHFCPDRDIVILNETGGPYFYAYERQHDVNEAASSEGGPLRILTVLPCDTPDFVCVAFGVPKGKEGVSAEVFQILMPADGAPGEYAKNGVHVRVSTIAGVAGDRRRHLVNWQDVDGRRQRVSAVLEQGKGLIYITGINLDDMTNPENGETCILQSEQGILAAVRLPSE